MTGRAEGVVDDRIENLVLDPGFKVHLAPLSLERVRYRRIVGVGDDSVRVG